MTPDDVKLLFRNSPTTVGHLDAILRKAEQEKRKTLPPSKAKKGASTKTSRATKVEDKNVSRTETPDSAPENALNPPKEDDNEAMEYDNDFWGLFWVYLHGYSKVSGEVHLTLQCNIVQR